MNVYIVAVGAALAFVNAFVCFKCAVDGIHDDDTQKQLLYSVALVCWLIVAAIDVVQIVVYCIGE